MKIAFTTQGDSLSAPLDPSFGRTRNFLIVDLQSETCEVISNHQNRDAAQGAGIQAAQTIVKAGAGGLITGQVSWGDYAEAIARHEHAFGQPAPAPTEPGPKGNPRLSARFVEWMMMLPAGWVTDVPGVTRNQALKALGNGVCPPQCVAALRIMLGRTIK